MEANNPDYAIVLPRISGAAVVAKREKNDVHWAVGTCEHVREDSGMGQAKAVARRAAGATRASELRRWVGHRVGNMVRLLGGRTMCDGQDET